MAKAEKLINKVLKEVAANHNFAKYELKIEPYSSGGANYTSTLYNVTVKEANNIHNFFVKIAVMGEKNRSQSPRFYYTEIFVYTKLAKIYEELEDQHEVPREHRLKLTKFYGCNPTLYEETVVLENLVVDGYQSYNRFKSIDWDYAESSLTEMAKLHALSFAYSEYHAEEFNNVLTDLKFEWDMENGPLIGYFKTISTRAINIVKQNARDKLERFFEEFGPVNFMNLFRIARRPVLVHGDFRPSNLMHRIRDVS